MERLDAVLPIRDIFSRVILNCCGRSALETEVLTGEDVVGRVSVPGNGREDPAVRADAEYINTVIAGELTGENIFDQERIDGILSKFERRNESLFCVSAAAASAAAAALKVPLYRYLGGMQAMHLPMPEIRMADNVVIMPPDGRPLREQLRLCREACGVAGINRRGLNPEERPADDQPDEKGETILRIRIGQTATLTEMSGRIRKAQKEGITVVFCSSEGETADTLAADLAVAFGADRIDAGPVCHMENVEKYNRLLRISEKLEMQLTEEK